jgi:hypothetical protein
MPSTDIIKSETWQNSTRKQQLSIASSECPRYVLPEWGDVSMANDVVVEILKGMQASIVALDGRFDVMDR